jgi:hypothetical protein
MCVLQFNFTYNWSNQAALLVTVICVGWILFISGSNTDKSNILYIHWLATFRDFIIHLIWPRPINGMNFLKFYFGHTLSNCLDIYRILLICQEFIIICIYIYLFLDNYFINSFKKVKLNFILTNNKLFCKLIDYFLID